jgi:excisionase family DNA binding protein
VSAKLVFEASEVAAYCSTDVATIYTWVKKGEIPHFKTPGGRLRFKREVVLDFLRRYQFPIPADLAASRPRVAVIDSDTDSLERTRRALQRFYDVALFTDPLDALLAIGHDKPDAVVLDVDLPTTNGVAFVRRLTAYREIPHMRVMVFSAREDLREVAMEAGAASFVVRPAVDELAVRLRPLLGHRG